MIQCDCIVIKHDRRCTKLSKYRCEKCGAMLCGTCAKQHHVHSEVVRLAP